LLPINTPFQRFSSACSAWP